MKVLAEEKKHYKVIRAKVTLVIKKWPPGRQRWKEGPKRGRGTEKKSSRGKKKSMGRSRNPPTKERNCQV